MERELQLLLQRGLSRRDRRRPRAGTKQDRLTTRGQLYEAAVARRLANGEDVFAPARRIGQLGARTVLDAGCGSGHIARFMAEQGIEVVGFDVDPEMLESARLRAPGITWLRADITRVDLRRTFDAVLVAGNVFNFVAPERISIGVSRMAAHVGSGGWLCAAFSRQGRFKVDDYLRWASDADLVLDALAADWVGTQLEPESAEVVVIHRRPRGSTP